MSSSAPVVAGGGSPVRAGQTLAARIAAISDEIGERETDRRTSGQGAYDYHSAKGVYGWWRPLLQRAGIIIVPRVLDWTAVPYTQKTRSGERPTWLTSVNVEFTITDGTDTIVGSALGQGEDPSDKGAGKAMTYAEKIFLLGLGMNGSEQDVEADHGYEDRSDRRSRRDDEREVDRRDRSDPPDEHRNEGRSVVIGDGSIEGIQRGGRANKTTDVQIARLRKIAREKGIDAYGVGDIAERVLGDMLYLPGDTDVGPMLISYLEGLRSTDAGRLIEALEATSAP